MLKDIFCRIVEGEIPAYKIWENENYLAFLDIEPKSQGHTLVIPKKHYRWAWEVPNFKEYLGKVKEVEKMLESGLEPEFVEMWVYGKDVPHAHIHLIPHYTKKPPAQKLEEIVQILTK